MSYHRTSSPGSRRIANPARQSDGYYGTAAYTSPRSSGERIMPIPAYVPRVDAYSGRPRRTTVNDPRPISTTTITPTSSSSNVQLPSRSRPAVVQSPHDYASPTTSSSHAAASNRASEYYAVPHTSSSSSRRPENSHRKLYSVDNGGKSRLVADMDIVTTPSSSRRNHSLERTSKRHSDSHYRQKAYHLTGTGTGTGTSHRHTNHDSDKNYDHGGSYEAEPRYRSRHGSVEGTRSRPSSTLIDQYGPRTSARDVGPPTARALDRFNDNISRVPSTRDAPPRSANRLSYQDHLYSSDLYAAPTSGRHTTAGPHQDRAVHDAYMREPERSRPTHRYEDNNVGVRGFGIRSSSQDRYGNRGSNESFDAYYSDRDRDRDLPPPRSDPRAYDYSKEPERTREYHARDPHRERVRDEGYTSERDRERHYDRSDKRDRDRERERDRRDRDRAVTPRGSGDSLTNSLLPAGVIGGLGAVAAAAYGAKENGRDRERDRDYDDRDRGDRDRDQERYREKDQKERDRAREKELQREREREQQDREKEREREYERERREREKEREREYEREQRAKDQEREQRTRERPQQQDVEAIRSHHSPSSDSGREGHRRSRRRHTAGEDTSPPSDKDRKHDSDERRRREEPERTPVDSFMQPQVDPDEDYRRRVEQAQRDLAGGSQENSGSEKAPPSRVAGANFDSVLPSSAGVPHLRDSTAKENRVRIVEPPSDRDEPKLVKGILKQPTSKFPEDPNPVREGVAPLKEVTKDGIPENARWTKIDRRLVNPQALEDARERFEERLDCVIVLRVLTKDEIQKLADKTKEIRDTRHYSEEDAERRERRERRHRERRERDEYSDEDSEDEYAPRAPRMLEAPESQGQAGQDPGMTADFVRERDRRRDRDREREREMAYTSSH